MAPKAAANNLRYALHNARRILGHTPNTASWCLPLRNGLITLCPSGELWVDVEGFDEAAKTARYVRNLPAYEAAVELYGGDLLPEDRYETWAEERRKALRGTYLALLLEVAGLYEEHGDFRSAIEALRQAVSSEPTHESAHTQLMRMYAVCGSRSEALQQYEQLRETLLREYPTCVLKRIDGRRSTLVLPVQPVAVSLM